MLSFLSTPQTIFIISVFFFASLMINFLLLKKIVSAVRLNLWILSEETKKYVEEKVSEIRRPEASAFSVDVKDVSLESITFHAKVNVSNPYIVPIPIGDVSYILKSAGRVIASGNISEVGGAVKGNGTAVLDLVIKAPYRADELKNVVMDISADWDIDYEFDVVVAFDLPIIGDITATDFRKGEIKLPTLFDLFN